MTKRQARKDKLLRIIKQSDGKLPVSEAAKESGTSWKTAADTYKQLGYKVNRQGTRRKRGDPLAEIVRELARKHGVVEIHYANGRVEIKQVVTRIVEVRS